MLKSRRRQAILAAGVVMVAGVAVVGQQAIATHTPANKVVASGSKTVKFAPGTNVTLMSGTMRTAKPTDVMFQVSLECSILTALTTGPSPEGGTSTATASGDVRVWVEVDDKVVPIMSSSQPPQLAPPPGDPATDKVTFCDRTYQRSVTDSESPLDGQDTERDYIRTKAANAFNWVRLNMQSGVHKIEVVGDLTAAATGPAGTAAEAIVGNRTMIAEPTKMANDATISENGN